jgi:hypothetical protein
MGTLNEIGTIKIFLDDVRDPHDCLTYMHTRIGALNVLYDDPDWIIVKNYPEFVKALDTHKGKINCISYDHDLADGHYHKNLHDGVFDYESEDFASDDYNKTGYHCAQYFKKVYDEEQLNYPLQFVHSMNTVGTQNIINLFK